jgi:nucleoside-diphosphate-sugar epimerase
MSKVLITGASGFIGTNVLNVLKLKGYDIHAVFLNKSPLVSDKNVTWHKSNLLDGDDIQRLFSQVQPTYLIHLAWCTTQGSYWTDMANLDWLVNGINLARNFIANGGKRCIFGGTSAEYDWSFNQPLNEQSTPLQPIKLYGGSKLSLYWTLTKLFEQEHTGFVWTRFFNPFGEHEDQKRLIPKTCYRLLKGERISFDAARSLRDFLHVVDVGEAVVSVLESDVNGPVNIGSGCAISVREVIATIADIYHAQDQIDFAPDNELDRPPDSVVADTSILNLKCNWSPSISFAERISQTCAWWKQQYKSQ